MNKGRNRLLILMLVSSFWFGAAAFAAEPVKDASLGEVEFIINPSISLELSGDMVQTGSLEPGTNKTSNHINVTVTTNNETGYKLNATVGNTTYDSRALILGDNVDTFESLDFGSSVNNLTMFTSGTWGVSFDSGSTFTGLPLYTDSENVFLVNQSSVATQDTVPFMFGASAKIDQTYGNYYNIVTFTAVANLVPKTIRHAQYLQQVDSDVVDTMTVGQQYVLFDQRDGKHYFISKFSDGTVWMTQDLDLEFPEAGLTLSPDTSDVTETRTLVPQVVMPDHYISETSLTALLYYRTGDYYFLNGNDASLSRETVSTYDITDVYDTRWHFSLGSVYSWKLAIANGPTADPDENNNNISVASESLCPKGWRLPSLTELQNSYSAAAAIAGEDMYMNFTGTRNHHYEQYSNTQNNSTSAFYRTSGVYEYSGLAELGVYTGKTSTAIYKTQDPASHMSPIRCILRQE